MSPVQSVTYVAGLYRRLQRTPTRALLHSKCATIRGVPFRIAGHAAEARGRWAADCRILRRKQIT